MEGKKIFIADIDSFVNLRVKDLLRTDQNPDQEQNIIYGTLTDQSIDHDNYKLPGVKKVYEKSRLKYITKVISAVDVVVVDLNVTPISFVEYIYRTTKTLVDKSITIVLISNLMTWAETHMKVAESVADKLKVATDDEEDGQVYKVNYPEVFKYLRSPLPDDTTEEVAAEEFKKLLKDYELDEATVLELCEYRVLSDADLEERKPHEKFAELKEFEDRAMKLNSKVQHLKTYVIGAGIMYGCGEQVLYEWFKTAWLQSNPLPYLNTGYNCLPLVHVDDVARLAAQLLTVRPENNYFVAVDRSSERASFKLQMKAIIREVSKQVGNGRIVSRSGDWVSSKYLCLPEEWKHVANTRDEGYSKLLFEQLKLNLVFKPSALMDSEEFQWHCKSVSGAGTSSFTGDLNLLREEFNENRKLSQIKIILTGLPATGKSELSARLSEFFNLPLLKEETVIKFWLDKALVDYDKYKVLYERVKVEKQDDDAEPEKQEYIEPDLEKAKEMDPYYADRKDTDEYMAGLAKWKNAKYDAKVKGQVVKPKLNDKLTTAAYKFYLSQNECKNRGFVLDFYPKTYEQCEKLFTERKEVGEGEDMQAVWELTKLVPETVAVLDCTDRAIVERIKTFKEEDMQKNEYFTLDTVIKRIGAYRKYNNDPTGKQVPLEMFFKQHQIDTLHIKVAKESEPGSNAYTYMDQDEIFEIIKTNVERKGAIINFYEHKEKEYTEYVSKRLVEKQQQQDEEQDRLEKQREEAEKLKAEEKERVIQERLAKLSGFEKDIVDFEVENELNKPLRGYLLENVVPTVTEALIDSCKVLPEDPIDFLAEYLLQEAKALKKRRQRKDNQ